MLLDIIKGFPDLVTDFVIIALDGSGPHLRLKARLNLRDKSVLHIKQIVLNGSMLKYAYHWETYDGLLLRRWDNAPHFPDVDTFPHHVHMQGAQNVSSSIIGGDLKAVLEHIQNYVS